MDILRLDRNTFIPTDLIEGYDSMIWTERYLGHGEFKLTSSQIYPVVDQLQEGQLISLRDSNEVMLVDTRSIEVDDNGIAQLVIVGRSLETFLENRVQTAYRYNEPYVVIKPYKVSEMLSELLWNNFVNTSGEDPTKLWSPDLRSGPQNTHWSDSQYAIPNVVVTDSTTLAQLVQEWWLEQGPVYPTFLDILSLGVFGCRTIRPNKTTGNVMTFDTSTGGSRGNVTKTSTSNIPQLRFDIYNGLDKTGSQTVRPSVIFHYDSGHIDNPSYLFSTKEYKNMTTISASFGTAVVFADGDASRVGLDRRDLFMDGGDSGEQDYNTFLNSLLQKGNAELNKYKRLRLFDGEISSVSPYIYGKDYYLGDFVTLLAGYGFAQTMMVSEYTRTQDSEGDRGFPGLSSLF
jgi:Siphovirus ReqiPepy6 Gp37-like protein